MWFGWILVIAVTALFGWGGWKIGEKAGIDGWVGMVIGIIVWAALVVLIPFLRTIVFFFLTGCCQ